MVTNSDGSIGPALPANQVRVSSTGQLSYSSPSPAAVYQTASTTTNTVTQVSAAVSSQAAAQSLVAGGIVVIAQGIWTNDAAAAAGGVPVGGLYKRTDGLVAFRQS